MHASTRSNLNLISFSDPAIGQCLNPLSKNNDPINVIYHDNDSVIIADA